MGKSKGGKASGETGSPDRTLVAEIEKRTPEGVLPCAVAFEIAKILGVSPREVGRAADEVRCKLNKCQLGLFGYSPHKKIVSAKLPADEQIVEAIRTKATEGRLPCAEAWQIADRFGVRKMVISAACEALGIKIKPCQLGAF